MTTQEPSEGDEPTARHSDVVFAYERSLDLPPVETFEDEKVRDPDERGGPVLRGIDMEIPAGSFTVIMGPSGGGKSTLLRTFNSIIPSFLNGSFAGDVDVLGRDATSSRVGDMAEDVGMVIQDYEAQIFGTSIDSEVAFGPENLAVTVEQIGPRIDAALELVGLDHLNRRRSPETLSGGQKQRLVFASVTANHPRLLILDEPTSDLDPLGTQEILSIVHSLATTQESGDDTATEQSDTEWSGPETIVLVTHKIEEALLADHVVLMRGGRIYRQGPSRDVFTDVDALRASRVAVPPIVEAFDRLGWSCESLPITPEEAVDAVTASDLEWSPPALAGESLPGAPAGTGGSPDVPVFELSNVVHEYETDQGSVRAVDGVDLTIRGGEVVAIVGHNGSGKTTLAKHLNRLLAPDEGSVTWRGQEVSELPMAEVGKSIGYVFQNPDHQIFNETIRKEVAFGPENFGIEGEELERAVRDAIETVELDGLEETDPFNLSKGQRQRVALASILATDPEVIIFDEPTTGLDATQRDQFMDLVAEINRESEKTIVMVTHNMQTVATYAPRTVVMEDGRLVYDGSTRELFADEARLETWDLTPPQPVEFSNTNRSSGRTPGTDSRRDRRVSRWAGTRGRPVRRTGDVGRRRIEGVGPMSSASLYVDRGTFLHRLTARTKMALVTSAFVVAFVFGHPMWVFVPLALTFVTLIWVGGWNNFKKLSYLVVALFVMGFVVWPFFAAPGGRTLLATSVLTITEREVVFALGRSERIATFIVGGILFVTTTTNEELVAGMRSLGIPYVFCFTVGMALRLFPTFLDSAGTVRQAQAARGHEAGVGGPVTQLKSYLPLLIPVLMSTLRNVTTQSMAFEARGFNPGRERTFYNRQTFERADWIVTILAVVVTAGAVVLAVLGYGSV